MVMSENRAYPCNAKTTGPANGGNSRVQGMFGAILIRLPEFRTGCTAVRKKNAQDTKTGILYNDLICRKNSCKKIPEYDKGFNKDQTA